MRDSELISAASPDHATLGPEQSRLLRFLLVITRGPIFWLLVVALIASLLLVLLLWFVSGSEITPFMYCG